MIGANQSPPQDVAHIQFQSRVAFKLVWCPPTFDSVRLTPTVAHCDIPWSTCYKSQDNLTILYALYSHLPHWYDFWHSYAHGTSTFSLCLWTMPALNSMKAIQPAHFQSCQSEGGITRYHIFLCQLVHMNDRDRCCNFCDGDYDSSNHFLVEIRLFLVGNTLSRLLKWARETETYRSLRLVICCFLCAVARIMICLFLLM